MMSMESLSGTDDLSAEAVQRHLGTRFMGRELYFFDTLPTTMDVADEKAAAGASDGTAIVADDQTAGRGRFDRKWVGKKGAAIAVSVVLRPPPEVALKLHMVCSLAVAWSIEKACGLSPRIKWPNDVLLSGKKVSGILLTANRYQNGVGHVNAGIGINVNLDGEDLAEIRPEATSLRKELGRPVSRVEVFCALMEGLERYYLEAREGGDLLETWQSYLDTLGKQVRVQWRREDRAGFVEEGFAEDVDEQGRLILRLEDGARKTLVSGEVTLHRPC